MNKNVLVVFGATGSQGGSVIDTVLADGELSKQFVLRGTSRDPSSEASKKLVAKGVEIMKASVDDGRSLQAAFKGAHTVFASTVTIYDGRAYQHEVDHGRALADAAVAAGVQHIIWSTLPNAGKISGGKVRNMGHFDGKEEVEQYIRTLPIKSAFVAPGCFMSNFHHSMAPHPIGEGVNAIFGFVNPETRLPLINTAADIGKWVTAILADFSKFEGKVLSCATQLYTFQEVVDTISRVTGKTVIYKQLPQEKWRQFLPPTMVDHIAEMLLYFQDYGYFGKDTEKEVEWSAAQARGKLSTLEEYLAANPLKLV